MLNSILFIQISFHAIFKNLLIFIVVNWKSGRTICIIYENSKRGNVSDHSTPPEKGCTFHMQIMHIRICKFY